MTTQTGEAAKLAYQPAATVAVSPAPVPYEPASMRNIPPSLHDEISMSETQQPLGATTEPYHHYSPGLVVLPPPPRGGAETSHHPTAAPGVSFNHAAATSSLPPRTNFEVRTLTFGASTPLTFFSGGWRRRVWKERERRTQGEGRMRKEEGMLEGRGIGATWGGSFLMLVVYARP